MKDSEFRQAEPTMEDFETSLGAEIDVVELFYRLLENTKKIIVSAVVGMLIFAFYSFVLATPMYEAMCQIYVTNASDSAINLSDLQIGNYLTSDYQKVFNAWEVHDAVRQRLGLDYSYEELQKKIEVKNPDDTRILEITATSDDPEEAEALANAYADVASGYISRTMDVNEPKILSSALAPEKPVRPRKLLNTVLGFILGTLLMCAVITVQFLMDDKIKTSEDIRKHADLAVLATVPTNSGDKDAQHSQYIGSSSDRKSRN